MKREIIKIRPLLLGIALLSAIPVILTSAYAHSAQTSTSQAPPLSFADLADGVKGAVVNISTTKVVKGRNPMNPFGGRNFDGFFGAQIRHLENFLVPICLINFLVLAHRAK